MIFLTSISPKHINEGIQSVCVNSWSKYGKVYSFNCAEEINGLYDKYDNVTFVETKRTMEQVWRKPLVCISALIDWAKTQDEDKFCIINSDIELDINEIFLERIEVKLSNSFIFANRCDYENEKDSSEVYTHGIDVFFLNKKYLNVLPPSLHCFGMTFWDYWIPYKAIRSGIKTIFVGQKIAYHKKHKIQYKDYDWQRSGEYFLWENELYQFNPQQGIGRMSMFVNNFIYANSTIEII